MLKIKSILNTTFNSADVVALFLAFFNVTPVMIN